MAGEKISAAPQVTPASADLIPLVHSGVSSATTVANLLTASGFAFVKTVSTSTPTGTPNTGDEWVQVST